jgi:AraC-like DNA-binding protein
MENPVVYRGRYLLAEGEFYRVRGNPSRAMARYRQAGELFSREPDGLFEKAYLLEKSALVLETLGDIAGAEAARGQAIARYRQWGLKWKAGLFETPVVEGKRGAEEAGSRSVAQTSQSPKTVGEAPDGARSPEIPALLKIAEAYGAEAVHAAVLETACWKSKAYAMEGKIIRPATFPELPGKMLTFAVTTGRAIRATVEDAEEQFFDTAYFFSSKPKALVVIPGGRRTAVLIVNPRIDSEMDALERMAKPVFLWLDESAPESGESPAVKDREIQTLMGCCRRLREHMREEKRYKDPHLTLGRLAADLEIPRRTITDALNACMGQNFQSFINSYRIEAIREEIERPENADATLLSMAFAAGFNSKSAFNDAFRKFTGISPSTYRAACAGPDQKMRPQG